ncbi:GNAT family N-acetyltransferase [Legionella hackeliae]|uniref:Putative Acetyltransferase, GNAT family n=1 Tax=Legionella hackeliae TaxID=449 RepID=A0A0A8UVJ6_LEGHA|nr:GNAT family N-acetyltransferase [Legionella hackeliae]KTD09586.1 GNAT family acetyltransferase [Legionella hackeliae]CEK11097.1 putative Acetyltransferase, GNAT family [Legionella hackeliae]STX47847.1 GNAT family acetyltransferase [Legionella hackeliae]
MTSQLINDFYACEDYFFSSVSKEFFHFHNQARIYITGVPVASLNIVFVRSPIENLNHFLNECNHFFSTKQLPWAAVFSTPHLEQSLDDYIANTSFTSCENAIAMWLDLNTVRTFIPNEGLLVKTTDSQLKEWSQPLIEAFHSTAELTSLYQSTHEYALEKKAQLHHLSLYVDNKLIASLTLSFHNNLARIDDFGTLPAYQKQGYGTYLLHFALETAKNLGADFCFLEAAEAGLSLYLKMGFEVLFQRKYVWDFQ